LTTQLILSKSYSVGVTAVLPTTLTLATTAPIRASSSVIVIVELSIVRVIVLATGLAVSVGHVHRSSPSLRWGIGDWARNILRGVVHVELLVDILGDRLDFCAELLFNLVQIEPILPVNEVDSKTQVSKSTRATNTVEVGFSILREVEVDDNIDCLNIDTASQQVGANQIATHAISEIMEHSVTVLLKHSSMGVKA
jgi:hypothetical protein